jgi:hypothetical protein
MHQRPPHILIITLTAALCTACTEHTEADEEAVPISLSLAVRAEDESATAATTSSTATTTTLPPAQFMLSFWASENTTTDAAGALYYNYFDWTPTETLDQWVGKTYTTRYYYPINNAPLYASGYAVDTRSKLTATLSRTQTTAGATTEAQSVDLQQQGNSDYISNDQWQYVYVTRDEANNGVVSGNRLSPFSKDLTFVHATTKLDLYMCRSTNMSGTNDNYNVKNVRVYAQERCIPTELTWTPTGGFSASAGTTLSNWSAVELLTYEDFLPTEDLKEVGSIYLTLDNFATTTGTTDEQLRLRFKADYGSVEKVFTTPFITILPNASKLDDHYHAGESYSLKFSFDIDVLTCEATLSDWEQGGMTIVTMIRPSEGGNTQEQ